MFAMPTILCSDAVVRHTEPIHQLIDWDTAMKLCPIEGHDLVNFQSLDDTSFRATRRELPVTKIEQERGELLKAAAQFKAVVTASCEISGAKQQLWGF